jgi:hypothetical protein
MEKFKMTCGCYFNDYGFKVGTKYLTIYNNVSNKTYKYLLTFSTIQRLKEIKDKYDAQDANRTYAVVSFSNYCDLVK